MQESVPLMLDGFNEQGGTPIPSNDLQLWDTVLHSQLQVLDHTLLPNVKDVNYFDNQYQL